MPPVFDVPFVCEHIEKFKLWAVNLYCCLLASICIMVQHTTWTVDDESVSGVFFSPLEVSKFLIQFASHNQEKRAVSGLTAANISVDDS